MKEFVVRNHSHNLAVSRSNDFVKVIYDSNTNTIICDFVNKLSRAQKQCNVQITSDDTYEEIIFGVYETNGTDNMLQTKTLVRVPGCYSYVVTAEDKESKYTVIVEGTFQNAGRYTINQYIRSVLFIFYSLSIKGSMKTTASFIAIMMLAIFSSV